MAAIVDLSEAVGHGFASLRAGMDNRFDSLEYSINKRFDSVDLRFDAFERRLELLEQ